VSGAFSELRLTTTRIAPTAAASTIAASNPYRRTGNQSRFTSLYVLHSFARRLLPE
jgi:hypothetical protein